MLFNYIYRESNETKFIQFKLTQEFFIGVRMKRRILARGVKAKFGEMTFKLK